MIINSIELYETACNTERAVLYMIRSLEFQRTNVKSPQGLSSSHPQGELAAASLSNDSNGASSASFQLNKLSLSISWSSCVMKQLSLLIYTNVTASLERMAEKFFHFTWKASSEISNRKFLIEVSGVLHAVV